MKRLMKLTVQLMLISTLLILSVASGFAAEVRREPSKASVEQGFLALTLDAEGAEDFSVIPDRRIKYICTGELFSQAANLNLP